MPAKSAAQQKAAGAALAAKRGETSPSSLKGAATSTPIPLTTGGYLVLLVGYLVIVAGVTFRGV